MNNRRRQINEAGWFYHAPARTKNTEPVGVPPPSQIPGLSDVSSEPMEAPKRTMFRDTDSEYVKLAKQGGRQDLLQNNYALRGRSKAAVDYPRVDWYYLEDNHAEEADKPADKDYKFLLPEYMVHEEYIEDNNSTNFRPKRAPYGYDRTQIYERETDPTKKDIKLPEVKHQGYGVRSEKLKNKPVPHNQPPPPKPIRQDDPLFKGSWAKKHQVVESNPRRPEVFATEYQMGFAKQPPKAGRRATPKLASESGQITSVTMQNARPAPRTAAQAVRKESDNDKELFKMSRFKNVPARTDSHRTTALPAGI